MQGFGDHLLVLRIEGAGGFVEDENRRLGGQGAGNAEALALAAGEVVSPFIQDRVVFLWQ